MTVLPYAIGGDKLPGLSKLIEETGEATEVAVAYILAAQLGRVGQVAGKIIALGEMDTEHWDGSNLRDRMIEELGDLRAAIKVFASLNRIEDEVQGRYETKRDLFFKWHTACINPPAAPAPAGDDCCATCLPYYGVDGDAFGATPLTWPLGRCPDCGNDGIPF